MLVMACMRVPSLFWREYCRFFIEGLLALSRLWGACGFYPGWRARRVHLVFWRLSCWCASVNFTCGFNFGHGLWLPCGATFAVLGGGGYWLFVLWAMGLCWPGDGPFRAVRRWGACGLFRKSRAQCARAPRLPMFIRLVSFTDTLLVV